MTSNRCPFQPDQLKCDPLVVLSGNTSGLAFPEIRLITSDRPSDANQEDPERGSQIVAVTERDHHRTWPSIPSILDELGGASHRRTGPHLRYVPALARQLLSQIVTTPLPPTPVLAEHSDSCISKCPCLHPSPLPRPLLPSSRSTAPAYPRLSHC